MFSGLKILLSGGFTSTVTKTYTKNITEHGGTVVLRSKPAPIFKPKLTPIESDINYIIVPKSSQLITSLCRQLNCTEIKDVKVLTDRWLQQCMKEKRLLDTSPYEANLIHEEMNVINEKEMLTLDEKKTTDRDDVECKESRHAIPSNLAKRSTGYLEDTQTEKKQRLEWMHCLDAASTDIAGAEDKGDGWRLLYTTIDGARKPSLLFKFSNVVRDCNRLIGFDMDGTIITTKSGTGKSFAQNPQDWKFLYEDVPDQLQSRYNEGAYIAIISNQLGYNTGKVSINDLKIKFDAIADQIGIPLDITCALSKDHHRKPCPGAWEFILRNRVKGDITGYGLYVGDAAGRPKAQGRTKDFSASDYKMALNAGIEFQTPEQFFRNSSLAVHRDRNLADLGFSWTEFVAQQREEVDRSVFSLPGPEEAPEIVLLMGPPASGKSTLARRMVADRPSAVRVNQDILKTRDACIRVARKALNQGKSVVVDNTNSSKSQRLAWIDLAKSLQHNSRPINVRCVRIELPKDACFHLARHRLVSPDTLDEDRREIPTVVVHTFFKRVEEPSLSEGFCRVDRVPFMPAIPDSESSARLLAYYL